MLRFSAVLLLVLPTAALALDGGVSLGGALKIDDPLLGEQSNVIDRLSAYGYLTDHWRAGVEGLYRKSRDSRPIPASSVLAPGVSPWMVLKHTTESVGLTADYDYRFHGRHAVGAGAAAGMQRIRADYDDGANDRPDDSYYAFYIYYNFFVTPNFNIGLSGRQQVDTVRSEYPATSNLNNTGLNNIVYNPYAGLSRTKEYRSDSLSLTVGYAF